MSEQRRTARPIQVRMLCDNCGEEMTSTGWSQPVSPPRFQNKCSNNHTTWSAQAYPYVDYQGTGLWT